MKKNRFLTFCFATLFGAGQMYLGMMKKGVTIMASIASLFAFTTIANIDELLFIIPVIWFYAFFDAMNGWHLSIEERKIEEEKFMNAIQSLGQKSSINGLSLKHRRTFGWGLVIAGTYIILNGLLNILGECIGIWSDSYIIYRIQEQIIRFGLSVLIIYIGIQLVKRNSGKKVDYIPYQDVNVENEQQK